MFNRNHGPLVFLLEAARIQGESAAPSGPMCLCSGIHHRPHQRVATGTSPLEVKKYHHQQHNGGLANNLCLVRLLYTYSLVYIYINIDVWVAG